MYQRQFQKLSPQITAHLAQTMTLLNMNYDELAQEINKALNENPALVVGEEVRCPNCNHLLAGGQLCPICTRPKMNAPNDPVVFISPRGEFINANSSENDDDFFEDIIGTKNLTIEEYVLRQVAPELAPDDQVIAAYILNQLDKDGFFKEDLEDVANYYHISLEHLIQIKNVIQKADPIGIGSASPQEAIRVQLQELKEAENIPEVFIEIADQFLFLLLKKQFKEIAENMNISLETVEDAAEFYGRNLNPFPIQAHWGDFRLPAEKENLVYENPDVIISHINNDPKQPLLVEIVIPAISNLDINPYYKQAIKESTDEIRDELKMDYDKANLFIKCIQQRNHTMKQLVEKITEYQKDFILNGDKFIKPLTRAKMSKVIGVHESTISRAVSNKAVQLPDGRIIPMSTFFDRSLRVRAVMKEIIKEEDKTSPLSDSEIRTKLAKRGYKVARRTVAKYRLMEGIMPAHQRKTFQHSNTAKHQA